MTYRWERRLENCRSFRPKRGWWAMTVAQWIAAILRRDIVYYDVGWGHGWKLDGRNAAGEKVHWDLGFHHKDSDRQAIAEEAQAWSERMKPVWILPAWVTAEDWGEAA